MNLTAEIEYHLKGLMDVVAVLLHTMMSRFPVYGVPNATLPRHVYFAILRVLRPAESALRRLIVVAARGMSVLPRPPRCGGEATLKLRSKGGTIAAFRLFDPRKRFAFGSDPQPMRIARESLAAFDLSSFETGLMSDPVALLHPPGFHRGDTLPRDGEADAPGAAVRPLPACEIPVDAGRLGQRLQVLRSALDDLPGQAQRLARALARRSLAPPGPGRIGPLRPGWPPGYRKRPRHEAEAILSACHWLAIHAPEPADTS